MSKYKKTSAPGFKATIEKFRGPEVAETEYRRAQIAVRAAMPRASGDLVKAYLDSRYGHHSALSVVDGDPVAKQIENRPARFHGNFRAVEVEFILDKRKVRGEL